VYGFAKAMFMSNSDLVQTARVTGSTLYQAIGLGTLKQQALHVDEVIYTCNIPKPELPASTKQKMGYRVDML
jgi:hypothetical protein